MGFLDGIFGGNGSNFQAQLANLQNPATIGQANQTFDQSQNALAQQQAFLAQLQGQGGVGNQSNVFAQQQQLANQLGQQAMGQGPNPALAQLANTTGQNINQQAALMASQRGAGANPALIARQAAQQGGQMQQQASGQAAVMQAQQQLAAQQALMQQQAQMGQLAGQQVGQQQQATGQANQFAQGLYGGVTGNINAQNNAAVQNASQANSANAQIAAANQKSQSGILGNLASGAANLFMGPLASSLGGMFGGGGGGSSFQPPTNAENYGLGNDNQGASALGANKAFADGGYVESGPRSRVGRHLKSCYEAGGQVKGKASVDGDSPENDTVDAKLSPDEIVIPRSIVLSKNAPDKAAMFVRAILAKKGMM